MNPNLDSSTQDYRRSLERARLRRPSADSLKFSLASDEWWLLDEVFNPSFSPSTLAFLNMLELPVGGSLLEVGCGAGIISVKAALGGVDRVVAIDLNPQAVKNTELNSTLHHVEGRVESRVSNMFEEIANDETFDLVFWHSNFVKAPADIEGLSLYDQAFVDPGYQAHSAFLRQALAHVNPGGAAQLGFSSRGDYESLYTIAGECGVALNQKVATTLAEPDGQIIYEILEVVRAESEKT
ncbi:hypothetical protein VT73_00715 [Rathayibacter toxicus]|uniref:Methyltransferase domain-containing protein n=1 Tax=Rathayibacter toxicus TaxID=145458 RepID=A0A0U1PVT5_9MICO|nr:hypothetical protein VT73_00715 [Rathayibacter toxicus]